jgi:HK97 family phage portal protein
MSKSLFGKLFNKAPVPYSSRQGNRDSIFSTPQKKNDPTQGMMEAYGSVGTLFAIVNRTATSVSAAEWKLYRKAKPGERDEDREEVTRHLALDVFNKPNEFMTRQEFLESIQQHIDLTGEAYWVVYSMSGFGTKFPTELWPVRPDKMSPVKHPTKFLTGWIYNGPDGEQIPLKKEDVIQIRMPNPLDPYRGMGPVQSIMIDLDSHRYSAEWNRNFFLNGAEPGGIIEVDARLSDEEFDEMAYRWREQHQGVANAHRIAILENGQWKERKFSQRDMQFAELRKISSEVIREAFGFPVPMLGTTENVNKAVAEAAETLYARHVIKPRLDRIKQALNHDFLPLFGTSAEGLEFDYENPVPDDRQADNEQLAARTEAATKLVAAGWDDKDVLLAVGLPPMKFKKPEPVAPASAGAVPGKEDKPDAGTPSEDSPSQSQDDGQE